MSAQPYIIWDWNGTLLDDAQAAVGALNRMMRRRGKPTLTLDFYREHFGFPVRPFYTAVGFELEHEDWDRLCVEFHESVALEPQTLHAASRAALACAKAHGVGQSILSALRQDLLLRDTAKAGIRDFFDAIYGVDNLDGTTKLTRGQELMAHLKSRMHGVPHAFYFIGDTLHDAEVASVLGARCVLVSGGHQTAARLAAAGCPVVASPLAAVEHVVDET